LDYRFDFTKNDVVVYIDGTMDLSKQSQDFLNRYFYKQTFRIVTVPASFGQANKSNVDYSDYNKVIQRFGINDKDVITIGK